MITVNLGNGSTCKAGCKIEAHSLQELVHHAGVGGGNFRRLSERVSVERLQDAWRMLSEWRVPKRFFLQYSVNSLSDQRLVLGVDFAMMAVLSHALCEGKLDLQYLHLEGNAILRSQCMVRTQMEGIIKVLEHCMQKRS